MIANSHVSELADRKVEFMANFKTHIGGGAVLGTVVGVATYATGLSDGVGLAALTSLLVIVGSVAPDIDSDHSVPFHITFGSLSLLAGAATFVHVMRFLPGQWLYIFGSSLAAMLFVWGAVGWVVSRLTHHRGMVHSVPSGVLGALLVFLSATNQLNMAAWGAFLLALSFCFGYVLHLVLDEIYAFVNFNGISIKPKKSFGSALKLFSSSRRANVIVYAIIIAIAYVNHVELLALTRKFVRLIS